MRRPVLMPATQQARLHPLSTPARLWPLFVGVAVLVLLWSGPLPAMSRWAFSPHMILHLGVAVVAAPLLAWGLARLLEGKMLRIPIIVVVLASAIEMVVVWGWHAPAMHGAAALHDGAFAAQQLSFLAAGIGIWSATLLAANSTALASGIVAMLFTFMHMAMLGALLALAPDLLYPPALCLGAFGLDPVQDQRLGGALMAVAGGAPFLVGGLAMAYRLLDGDSR